MMQKELSKVGKHDAEVMFAIMSYLKEQGGTATVQEIYDDLPKRFAFSEDDLRPHNTWKVGWHCGMHMIGIEVKGAGYLDYHKGVWQITEDGEKALSQGVDGFYRDFKAKWREHLKNKKSAKTELLNDDVEQVSATDDEAEVARLGNQAIKDAARSEIREHILKMSPMVFQDFVAALFKAMGYHIPYVARPGKDKGVDIVIHQDPLGIHSPHVKVQVKHYPNTPISVDVVRSLVGTLHRSEDVGIVVTSGRFTNDCVFEARESHRFVRLIDGNELIDLWEQYYDRMEEEDKEMLPIEPIYFLKHDDEGQ